MQAAAFLTMPRPCDAAAAWSVLRLLADGVPRSYSMCPLGYACPVDQATSSWFYILLRCIQDATYGQAKAWDLMLCGPHGNAQHLASFPGRAGACLCQ